MSFDITFSNVLLTLLYILPGYIICRMGKVSPAHQSSLSGVLVYACSPCMIVSSFLSLDYSAENVASMGLFFAVTLALQTAFMLVLYLLLRSRYADSRFRILTIGSVLGNVGFFGLPLVRALLPDHPEVLCYASIYVLSMNILVFTAGVYCLTQDRRYLSLCSALINPSMLGFAVGFPLFLLGGSRWMPALLMDGLSLLGRMSTPLCMIILGIRIATVDLKALFSRPFVYLVCLCKLVVFPLFCWVLVKPLPLPEAFRASLLVLSAVPCASIIFNMAEIHHREVELSANCVMLSTLLCLLTIPLVTMVL